MNLSLLFLAASLSQSSPLYADVSMHDGSSLRVAVLDADLVVDAKYGRLTIPFKDVKTIDFACHMPHGVGEDIAANIQKLGAAEYRVREQASQFLLRNGVWAYKNLQAAANSSDPEASLRAHELLASISKRIPKSRLQTPKDDVVHTAKFTVVGRITTGKLKVRSVFAGEMELGLCRALRLTSRSVSDFLVMDASNLGVSTLCWRDTKIQVDGNMRITVKAAGKADLYPIEPGTCVATPDGYTSNGRDCPYAAGVLLGRIGESGLVFVVGGHYRELAAESGTLFLAIAPSPWPTGTIGEYRVSLAVEHVE